MNPSPIAIALISSVLAWGPAQAASQDFFRIQVIDDQTGRGVPLVELTTVNHITYVTDSAGLIAFYEPGLMDQGVFVKVKSHGYEYPKDRFGYRGVRLRPTPGGQAVLKIKRLNIAERLYRVTGGGIYRDSILLGESSPIRQPLLNAQVFGSDSVVNAVYHGQIYWFWGDTNRPSYPLGNFHVPGAISQLPSSGGLDPEIGVDLTYFTDQGGFAKPTCRMPGQGPTWINGLVVLRDGDKERLFCTYVKVQPPLKVYERGLAEFNNHTRQFDKVVVFDMQAPLRPGGHPLVHNDDGKKYVYFGDPFPLVRVAATPESLRDLSQYEAYTCLKAGSRNDSLDVQRDGNQLVFGWKPNTVAYTSKLQARLIKEGKITQQEGLLQLFNKEGKPILIHRGSVCWNDYRQRWIMIAVESFGASLLGEVWYAESQDLVGPWTGARKVVTHDRYSFYNPKIHPMLEKDGGRIVFFEGTYTTTFSGNDRPTPRYNYNQVMYKLDLSDPRLR